MTRRPLLSVIMPVYNSEAYLKTTLDCILAQTYTNLELVIVNDGSTDGSAEILDQYAHIHSNIKVFHRKNFGVSAARNFGLDQAKGELIGFVDSDDMPTPAFYESLVSDLIDSDVDLSVCDTSFIDENVCSNMFVEPERPRVIRCNDSELDEIMFGAEERKFWCIWDKVYKISLIKESHLYFDESLRIGEDTLFALSYLFQCTKLTINDAKLYRHRIRKGSLMRSHIPHLAKQNVHKIDVLKSSPASTLCQVTKDRIVDIYTYQLLLLTFNENTQQMTDFRDSIIILRHRPDLLEKIHKHSPNKRNKYLLFMIKHFPPIVSAFIYYSFLKLRKK